MSEKIPYSEHRERDKEKRRKLNEYYDFFISHNNISVFDIGEGVDPQHFIEKGTREYKNRSELPPHYDHIRLCKKKNGPRFVIYCPYAQEDKLKSDREWAEERGLHFVVYDKWTSMYGCGSTMVVLSKEKLILSLGHFC